MRALAFAILAGAAAFSPSMACASVAQVAANGFVVRHAVQVSASPDEAWAVLVKPSVWWDSDHTWSGDAANLTLDARPGGCFCEVLPNATSAKAAPRGGVEHMRVVYVERGRALRMSGALGPLQSDALDGTLTVQIKADGKGGSQILLEYVVGGFSRTAFDKLAPAVDSMLGEQMGRLTGKLGGAFADAFPSITPSSEAPASVGGSEGEQAPAPADPGIVPLSDAPATADEPPAADDPLVGR